MKYNSMTSLTLLSCHFTLSLTLSTWCSIKGHTYLNKPAAERCKFVKFVWPFSGHQALITEAVARSYSLKKLLLKFFSKLTQIPTMSFFSKVATNAYSLPKKGFHHQCFYENFRKCFTWAILKKICAQMFLDHALT